jgi:hypothetical protein
MSDERASRQSWIPIDRCSIRCHEAPSRACVEDARISLSALLGSTVSMARQPQGPGTLSILVGTGTPADQPNRGSPEAFRVEVSHTGSGFRAVVNGRTPAALARGLSELVSRVEVRDGAPCLPSSLSLDMTPRFELRGMHPNGWAAGYPYAFRCWKEEDWLRYVDMLFHLGANLLLLWPSVDIIPVPLSAEDEQYLLEVRRVVQYARAERGFEVWIMHSANRIALSDCGVRDPRLRPYWLPREQVDLDPGDPDQLDRILRSREPLYRIVDNADGVAIIDSDPGGWNGSPVRDSIRLFQKTRALLDRTCARGSEAKLVNWIWQGWGFTTWDPARREGVIAETVGLMREILHEPWMLIAGSGQYLPYLQRLGALDRTVYLPYGAIEAEPSLPFTNVDPDSIEAAVAGVSGYPGVVGFMGNVQCPVLQFPQTHDLLRRLWDIRGGDDAGDPSLRRLARLLHPRLAEELARTLAALNAPDPAEIDAAIVRARSLAGSNRTHGGLLGHLLFPVREQILRDLVSQLEVRRAEAALAVALEAGVGAAEAAPLVAGWFRECLAWEAKHGYFGVLEVGRLASLFPRPPIPRDTVRTWPPYVRYAADLRRLLQEAGDPGGARFFEGIGRALSREFREDKVMRGCVEAMKIMMERNP